MIKPPSTWLLYLTLYTNFQIMLHLMKLKGCVSLLNILCGYSIITFKLRMKTGGRGVMSVQTFTHIFF